MVIRIRRRWLGVIGLFGLAALVLTLWGQLPVLQLGMNRPPTDCGEDPEGGAGDDGSGSAFGEELRPAASASAQPDTPPQVNDPQKLHIFIDGFRQRLTLFEGEREVVSYPVAVGKPDTPSPPGEWRITNKSTNWGGGFGTRWLGINVPWGIYGIHGTNKPWSIGTRASAGCIRMFNPDVEQLYELVPVGTRVVISGMLPEVAPRARIAEPASGKFVLVLQVRLRQAGFEFGPIDGRFGPAVARAVRNLQALYGFPVDGVLTRDQQRILWFPE
ncbi:MAG TPA: L,D-transpeptidase family protein [Bacillota bacterium]